MEHSYTTAADAPAVDWSDPFAVVDKKALAKRRHQSERSLERDIQQGTAPPHLKVGKRTLFRVRYVLEWEEAHVFSSTAEAKAAKEHEAAEIARRHEERKLTKAATQGIKAHEVKADEIASARRYREREGAAE